jgi:iron complex transport system ATP-binding protein
VTLLSQSRPVPNGLGVRDVVEFGRHPYRGRWRAADPDGADAVERAMLLTGIRDLAERGVDELSGGQLQRVWLASCLAQHTTTLLLDEPTNHLDLRYQVEILDLVHELARDHGVAIGLVLHDLDQAAAIADRVVVLCDGRVVADGSAHDALRAELLSEVYGIRIEVDTDPVSGCPRTRAVGRHSDRMRDRDGRDGRGDRDGRDGRDGLPGPRGSGDGDSGERDSGPRGSGDHDSGRHDSSDPLAHLERTPSSS